MSLHDPITPANEGTLAALVADEIAHQRRQTAAECLSILDEEIATEQRLAAEGEGFDLIRAVSRAQGRMNDILWEYPQ